MLFVFAYAKFWFSHGCVKAHFALAILLCSYSVCILGKYDYYKQGKKQQVSKHLMCRIQN